MQGETFIVEYYPVTMQWQDFVLVLATVTVVALLASWFDRLDLVLREDFDVQKKLLERAQAKLAELEARIKELEGRKPQR